MLFLSRKNTAFSQVLFKTISDADEALQFEPDRPTDRQNERKSMFSEASKSVLLLCNG